MMTKKNHLNNQSGFIVADFLFAFVLIISCGIVIFALTFSLATVEVSQYIVWSTARNFSAANYSESEARSQAKNKFNNLADQFPALTGRGNSSGTSWFVLDSDSLILGNLAKSASGDSDLVNKLKSDSANISGQGELRQPWIGAKADLELKMLSGLRVPFLGPLTTDKSKFTFPIRAFILRHPSYEECVSFYSARFSSGIQKLEPQMNGLGSEDFTPIEDNGC